MKDRRTHLRSIVSRCFDECSDFYPLRGDSESRRLLIAPPLTEQDIGQGIPFSGSEEAKFFDKILRERLGLSTNSDFVVVSCTDTVGKVVKNNTAEFLAFLKAVIDGRLFDFYLCVGSDAFKTAFGRGRKPSMESLAGNIMIMPEAKNRKVAVFPDVHQLCSVNTRDYAQVRVAEYHEKLVNKAVNILKGRI